MSAPQPFIIQRLRVQREQTGSANFAQEDSANVGDFLDVYFKSAEFSTDVEMLDDEGLVQEHYDERKAVPGRRTGTLNVAAHLTGAPTALDSSASAPASPPDWALGRMLDVVFGGHRAGQGSTVNGTPSVSDLDVDTGHGSRWVKGAGVATTIGGRLECNEVASVSTDTLTPRHKWSAAPTGSAEVYNAHTFYLTPDPNETLQFLLEHLDRNSAFWALGCNGNLSLELSMDQLPTANFQLAMADWAQDDEVSNPVGGSALARGTLTDSRPSPFLNSRVLFGPRASGAPHEVRRLRHSELSLTLNFQYDRVPAVHAVNNIDRWRLIPQRPMVSGSISLVYEDNAHRTAREAETEYYFWAEHGSAATQTVCVSLPRIQIMNVQPAEVNGLLGETVEFKALSPEPGTTDLGRSPILLHHF